jgi:hypothetical protein
MPIPTHQRNRLIWLLVSTAFILVALVFALR